MGFSPLLCLARLRQAVIHFPRCNTLTPAFRSLQQLDLPRNPFGKPYPLSKNTGYLCHARHTFGISSDLCPFTNLTGRVQQLPLPVNHSVSHEADIPVEPILSVIAVMCRARSSGRGCCDTKVLGAWTRTDLPCQVCTEYNNEVSIVLIHPKLDLLCLPHAQTM